MYCFNEKSLRLKGAFIRNFKKKKSFIYLYKFFLDLTFFMHKYNYNSTNFQKIANNLIIQLAFYSISNSNVYIQILPLNCIY